MRNETADLRRRIRELEASNAAAAADVRFLAAMERVSRIARKATDLDELLEQVLDELLSLFGCDRAWLLHPCDPEAEFWGVPKERTVPAWPGVFALGVQIPMEQEAATVFAEALATTGALPFDDTTERKIPVETTDAFGVQAQMIAAIRPHSGKAWLLGLHHCADAHVWTAEEQRSFEGVASRVADALDTLVLLRDLRHSESQITELQRAEAIGSLAGGVAHDFNNQLLVILCYSEMLREELDGRGAEYVEHVLGAASQAADLTRQLLAFSRRAVLQPRPIDLSTMAQANVSFLDRAVGKAIEVRLELSPHPAVGTVDPSQLEQVLVNLVMNARDAMPNGGTVTIRTDLRALEADDVDRPPELPPGLYARLSVIDDGVGMDEETRLRVFEPFFTTKERGKGTGFGLSTAYGVARQSEGTVSVVSTPGQGAWFTVWLPASDDSPTTISGAYPPVHSDRGTEHILVVDPRPEVVEVAARVLRGRGYQVTGKLNAAGALAVLKADDTVDLLMTEVVMPGEDGVSLVERALRLRPSLRATFCTDYSPPTIARLRDSGATRRILQKPFTPSSLLEHVRHAIDR